MKAISLVPGSKNVSLIDINEPQITSPDEIKMQVLQVGICGTDREEVSGGRADAPSGKNRLVIGHEMLGKVVETGKEVNSVKAGDYGVFMVRRGCGECNACLNDRSDMCYTGNYTERGIKGYDGFQSQFVVDKQRYFVKVPMEMKSVGVLTEPMSIVSKAIDEALIIQGARLGAFEENNNWLNGKRALVAGIGAVGLMAAFALRLRGAEVIGMDIVDESSARPQILLGIGGRYLDGRKVKAIDIDKECGESDFIFEATGIPELQINLIDALATNGIYVATGIPADNRSLNIPAADLLRQLVLKNQLVLGSVNAGLHHYRMAVEDLRQSLEKWPDMITSVITERISFNEFKRALLHPAPEEIKVVIEW